MLARLGMSWAVGNFGKSESMHFSCRICGFRPEFLPKLSVVPSDSSGPNSCETPYHGPRLHSHGSIKPFDLRLGSGESAADCFLPALPHDIEYDIDNFKSKPSRIQCGPDPNL